MRTQWGTGYLFGLVNIGEQVCWAAQPQNAD